MRKCLVLLIVVDAGFLTWGAWAVHLDSLRALANEPWTPPNCVWSCREGPVVAAEPGSAPLRFDVVDEMSCTYERYRPERIRVAPSARANARDRLNLDTYDLRDPEYRLTKATRLVAGVEWRRWDAVPAGR